MHYVYVLRCSDGTLYVGRTTNLIERETWHNDGHGAAYTAARRPVRIVYAEELRSEVSAARREGQIKRWTSAKKEALVQGDSAKLTDARRKARSLFTWRDWLRQQ